MYQIGYLVYIYYNDLATTLLSTRELRYTRFGYITEIDEYIQDNAVNKVYTVRTVSGANFKIDQTQELKLCSYDELVSAVGTIKDQISEQQHNAMLDILNLHKKA